MSVGSVDCHCLSFGKNKNGYAKTCRLSVSDLKKNKQKNLRDNLETIILSPRNQRVAGKGCGWMSWRGLSLLLKADRKEPTPGNHKTGVLP